VRHPPPPVPVDQHAIDWTAVGAVAGPVLALASLAWQATERLRRPVLGVHYRWSPYNRMHAPDDEPDWGLQVSGIVRVINPRPVPIIVEDVELEARVSRWASPQPLDTHSNLHQIGPVGEAEFSATHHDLRAPVYLRMRVRLRGRRRRLKTPWEFEDLWFGDEGAPRYGGNYGTSMRPEGESFPPGATLPNRFSDARG
jgi:hypothetical protein